jgi:hypothetical protein
MNDWCLLAARAVEGCIGGWIHRRRGDRKSKKFDLKSLTKSATDVDEEESLMEKKTGVEEEPQRRS